MRRAPAREVRILRCLQGRSESQVVGACVAAVYHPRLKYCFVVCIVTAFTALTCTSIAMHGVLLSGLALILWFPVLLPRTLFSLCLSLKSGLHTISALSLPVTSYVGTTPSASTEGFKYSGWNRFFAHCRKDAIGLHSFPAAFCLLSTYLVEG